MHRRIFLSMFATSLASPKLSLAEGFETNIDSLLAEIESLDNPPLGGSGRLEAKDYALEYFGATTPRLNKSATPVGERAVRLVIAFEVSSESTYEAKFRGPIWPGGNSGVTIGIGYDLGYSNGDQFGEDWRNYLNEAEKAALIPALGVKGTRARDLLPRFGSVQVPFRVASSQFASEALPRYVALTESALSNTSELHPECLGALVSLVYNRGPSFNVAAANDPSNRYSEMRNIADHMRNRSFDLIPDEIRSMKRIWEGKGLPGLLWRRDVEAELFEYGLRA